MPEFNSIQVVPTGGVVALTFTTAASSAGNISLTRAISGASGAVTLYSGAPLNDNGVDQIFIDVGDNPPGPPLPLNPNTLYVYTLTDPNGSVQSGGIQPNSMMVLLPDGTTDLIMRTLQAAINANYTQGPSGVGRATVLHAMPLAQLQPMPFVVVFLELLQQGQQFIGDDNANEFSQPNYWVQGEFARRVYRISILSINPIELDFYRDLIISTFKVMHTYVFPLIGQDMEHSYQSAAYQETGDNLGKSPGFYGCDISLELTGTFNLQINVSTGLINTITTDAITTFSGAGATGIFVSVPVMGIST